ncbi:NUC153 domain-containing protein [Cephalotus follicularis]|uniref:NUC153 domain-containing protein n=1 Tax=Cephalotus follicularis TaxID=3775 RepID=A0A1Q3C723_CEPFO|nr:NUC153 domain-containing protein [Cephalotus follicularis]
MGSKNKDHKKNKKEPNKGTNPNDHGDNAMITDSRFASAHLDPRFHNVPKHKSKVEIDSRFNRIFTDKDFASSGAPLDKRGKRKKQDSQSALHHYYRIGEEEEKAKNELLTTVDEDADEEEEAESESESGSALDTEDGYEVGSTTDEDVEDDDLGALDIELESVPEIEKETHRIAVVNMDWKHVKAVDLYVMFSDCLPKSGRIVSVAVYPSEFGLQRMKEEEVHGPAGLFDDKSQEDDDDEIDNEKLREFEKSRLRYYYAVVECDSTATADYLYKACDGVEFERSANVLDLRFIPDSMEFKHPPRDAATEAPVNYEGLNFETRALQQSEVHNTWDDDEPQRLKTLKGIFKLSELELKEIIASDSSDTDDDDDHENAGEDKLDKKHKKQELYHALIQSGNGSDEDGEDDGQDMEVTFNTGLEDISKRILEKKDKKSETVLEAYLRKRREKKKDRKNKYRHSSDDESIDTDQEHIEQPDDFFVEEPAIKKIKDGRSISGKEEKQIQDREAEASRAELELLLADEKGKDTGLKGYNLNPKKAKGKKGKEVPDESKIPTADYDDPRFSSLFTSPLFALDPTDPRFKRSAAYARQLAQKRQKGDQEDVEREHLKSPANAQYSSDDPETNKSEHAKSDVFSSKKEKHELSSLVRSIKMKSKQVQSTFSNRRTNKDDKLPLRGIMGKEKQNELSIPLLVKKAKK